MSRRITYKGTKNSDKLMLSLDGSSEANIRIDTHSGMPSVVNWDDGNVEVIPSTQNTTHPYSPNHTGAVKVIPFSGYVDISRFYSQNNPTAWDFDLGVFVPLTELIVFRLDNLPNSTITGDLSTFSGMTGLTYFQLINLPNANIDGSLNSFSGATGLNVFSLDNLPNATITGSSSDFASMTNLRDFAIYVSPSSTITMEYDDVLNIWQNAAYINHRYSGISASKATTDPFNFTEIFGIALYFISIGLSTASMDNMIISLDNSLIVQSSPKTIYLNLNAPHSGSPAVTAAISSLTSKNITLVL